MRELFLVQLFIYFPELTEMKGSIRENIISLIYSTVKGNFRHELFPQDRIFAFDVHSILRKINKRNWKKIIEPFFQKKINCADYTTHITDGWTYTDRMEIFLNEYSEMVNRKMDNIINVKREIKINIERGLDLLNYINQLINQQNVKDYNKRMKPRMNLEKVTELMSRRDFLALFLSGTIKKEYKEGKTKRLFMVCSANLQQCPSEIRRVLLSELGNYDYDIKNCHFTIIWQLIDEVLYGDYELYSYLEDRIEKKILFSELYKLVQNPDSYKSNLANEWCITIPKVKQILTSLVNGGAQNFNSKCFRKISLISEQERTHQNMILKSGEYIRLKNNMKMVKDYLYDKYKKEFKSVKKKDFISYLIHSRERKILNVIIQYYNPELLIHDGWILNKNIPEELIEQKIMEKTGFKVKLKKLKL